MCQGQVSHGHTKGFSCIEFLLSSAKVHRLPIQTHTSKPKGRHKKI